MKKRIANWANNILRAYGFENWRTIWAFRIAEWICGEF